MINIIILLVLYYFVSDFECKVTKDTAKVSCSNLPKWSRIIVQIFQNAVKWAFCASFPVKMMAKKAATLVWAAAFLRERMRPPCYSIFPWMIRQRALPLTIPSKSTLEFGLMVAVLPSVPQRMTAKEYSSVTMPSPA